MSKVVRFGICNVDDVDADLLDQQGYQISIGGREASRKEVVPLCRSISLQVGRDLPFIVTELNMLTDFLRPETRPRLEVAPITMDTTFSARLFHTRRSPGKHHPAKLRKTAS